MQMTKKQWLVAGIGFLIAVFIVGGFWYERAKAPAPESSLTASTTLPVATTSAPSLSKPAIMKFPINPKDTIAAWSFTGAYVDNDTLLAKANADTSYLKNLIGKGQYNDYDLYIGIGNNSGSIGDGASAYQNYNRAITLDPERALAYANMGHLMEQLGAYYTAADAYAKAVAKAPSVAQYRNAQFDFLTRQFPEEAARLKANQ